MKTQPLGKRLLIPLLLVEIAATGVGLSSPAQSTSLIGSQGTVIPASPKPTLVAQRHKWCLPGQPPPECDVPGRTAPSNVRRRYQRYLRQQERRRHRSTTPSPTRAPSPNK